MPTALWALSDKGSRVEIREVRRKTAQGPDEGVVRMSLKRRATLAPAASPKRSVGAPYLPVA
jgi:hypothetical protein